MRPSRRIDLPCICRGFESISGHHPWPGDFTRTNGQDDTNLPPHPATRTTLYEDDSDERIATGLAASKLTEIINTPVPKYELKSREPLERPGPVNAIEV